MATENTENTEEDGDWWGGVRDAGAMPGARSEKAPTRIFLLGVLGGL